MTKKSTVLATLVFALSIVTTPAWAAGGKVRGEKAAGPAGSTGPGLVNLNRGDGICDYSLTTGTISEAEAEYILYMVQEEKLARDVYISLYEYYNATEPLLARVFLNISTSEQRHMDAIQKLILNHGLANPVENFAVGEFPAPGDSEVDFNALYDKLLADGLENYCDALEVGIQIEELEIDDLETALGEIEAQDVARVFENLLNGSENHLDAFSSRIEVNCQ